MSPNVYAVAYVMIANASDSPQYNQQSNSFLSPQPRLGLPTPFAMEGQGPWVVAKEMTNLTQDKKKTLKVTFLV